MIRKTAIATLLAAWVATSAVAHAAPATQVYDWLKQQQGPHGILGNQDHDAFAGLYPNALAAMCFLHQGDIAQAEKIYDYYNSHFKEQFAPGAPGGFPQAANAGSGELLLDTDRWIGDNAWLLISLNYYKSKTKSTKYDEMRHAIGQWLVSLQDEGGGIKAGFNKAGPMTHYSTEGNLDCSVALVDFPEARQKVIKFLTTDMYVPSGPHFKMGSTVSEPSLDTCSWAVQALGAKYAPVLKTADARFRMTDTSEANHQPIDAFADFVEKKHVWLEGTGEMAVAYNVAGRTDDAKRLIGELEKAMIPSVAHPGTVGIPCSTTDPAWKGATTLPFTPSQAWYLCATWNFNPMASVTEESHDH